MTLRRIDLLSLLVLSLQTGLLPPSLPIAQRTQPEASRKTMAARAGAIARWVDMNPAEMPWHRATADKPASRGTRSPLADAATVVVAAAMLKAAAVEIEAEEETAEAAAGIGAAKRKVDEEFRDVE